MNAPAPRRPPARRGAARCVVTGVERLTPRMVRVRLRGEGLVGAEATGPDQRVKLAFPDDRVFGDDPAEAGRARRRRRTYTLLHLDPGSGTAAVDFVVHGGGVAGRWAANARPGDEVDVTTPVGRYELRADAGEHLFACDETGLPALRAIVAGLPLGVRARAFVEVEDAAERQELPSPAELSVVWLERAPAGAAPGALLGGLAPDLRPPADAAVWIAGESDAVRRLRTHLVADAGLDRSRVTAVAYWQRGHAEGDPARGRPD